MNRDTRLSGVLHVLLHLEQAKGPATSETLARTMGTNAAVFRRTMAGLRTAGYLHSEKGHGGGWTLSRPLSEITLLDIYDALGHSQIFAIGLRNDRSDCKVEQAVNGALSETLCAAEALIRERFRQVTLDRLAQDVFRDGPVAFGPDSGEPTC